MNSMLDLDISSNEQRRSAALDPHGFAGTLTSYTASTDAEHDALTTINRAILEAPCGQYGEAAAEALDNFVGKCIDQKLALCEIVGAVDEFNRTNCTPTFYTTEVDEIIQQRLAREQNGGLRDFSRWAIKPQPAMQWTEPDTPAAHPLEKVNQTHAYLLKGDNVIIETKDETGRLVTEHLSVPAFDRMHAATPRRLTY